MSRPFESIIIGFWAHFAEHVKKVTPPSRIMHAFYAILGLQAAIIDFLLVPGTNVQELKQKGSKVLQYIVHVNIGKVDDCPIQYKHARYSEPLSGTMLLECMRSISVAGQMHIQNHSTPSNPAEFLCRFEANNAITKAANKILQVLPAYTGCTLRELAILHQQETDPDTYEHEKLHGQGLEHLPVEYV
jgi:hypothetical protein